MSTQRMSMSSLVGKRILSLIRDGDFAHPGEVDAVDALLEGWPSNPGWRVLDVGCGLGATADLIARRGHGQVHGVDADPGTIDYARSHYPGQSFSCASALDVSTAVPGPFDAIVMFTSFYCFPDQPRVLRECGALARADTILRIFDYATPTWNPAAEAFCQGYARGGHWRPLVMDECVELFESNGWQIVGRRDLTAEFRLWYRDLVARIASRREAIVSASDEGWYLYALQRYRELLDAIENGPIGGAIISAVPR